MLRLRYCAITALLAVVSLNGPVPLGAAESDSRAILAGRQAVRARLVSAMSDGHLSPMEQYQVLAQAKQVLPPEDMAGLEQSLERLVATEAEKKTAAASGPKETAAPAERAIVEGEPLDLDSPLARRKFKTSARRLGMSEQMFVEPGAAKPQGPGDVLEPGFDEECVVPTTRMGRIFGGPSMVEDGAVPAGRLANLSLWSGVDGFKGPMDLDNINGNFGIDFGINAGIPLARRLGIGMQLGTDIVLSDFHGTVYTDTGSRTQVFTSIGLFQRIPAVDGAFLWGFTHDWLYDDYYATFNFGQWRLKAGWEINPWNEVGIWAAIRDHGDSAEVNLEPVGGGTLDVTFRPLNQGNLYWTHRWCSDATTTARFGLAEQPGSFIFGLDGRAPLTSRLALIGGFTYVSPSSSAGFTGQSEEFWSLSFGMEFVPGGFRRGAAARFTPVLPVANNGTMVVRER